MEVKVSLPQKSMPIEEMVRAFENLKFGVLATSDHKARPYTSLISFVLTPIRDKVIFATPRNSNKYQNIINQPAVSIMLDNRSQDAKDFENAQAVTLLGMASEVDKGQYRQLFLDRHHELEKFIDDDNTAIICVELVKAIHVANFQDTSSWP